MIVVIFPVVIFTPVSVPQRSYFVERLRLVFVFRRERPLCYATGCDDQFVNPIPFHVVIFEVEHNLFGVIGDIKTVDNTGPSTNR